MTRSAKDLVVAARPDEEGTGCVSRQMGHGHVMRWLAPANFLRGLDASGLF